jgi:Putative zinc-finger
MNASAQCDHFRGLLAMEVVGQISAEDTVALSAHLDGCPECRQEAADLRAVAAILPAAQLAHLQGQEMAPGLELERAVLVSLESGARRSIRRRRMRYVAAGAVAAGIVAIALVLTVSPSPSSGQNVALHGTGTGTGAVRASVRLTAQSWGTAVDLEESGQPGGQVLTVSMRTASGSWWTAGTYRTVQGKDVHVTMACALPLSDIETVYIKDRAGQTVLSGYVS